MTPESVWKSLKHADRVRYLAEAAIRLGSNERRSIVDAAREAAYRDAKRDARVVDRCVGELGATTPHGISGEALR